MVAERHQKRFEKGGGLQGLVYRDDIVFDCVADKLHAVFEPKFIEDILLVCFHGLDANEKGVGNFLVAFPGCNLLYDLILPAS